MTKPRMALCVSREEILDASKSPMTWNYQLMDRAIVDPKDDKDLNPSIQQLLPYVTIVRARNANGDMQVLCYRRPTSGGEDRLHEKWSVGFGGHVDTVPNGTDLITHLGLEAARELKEELGVVPNVTKLVSGLARTLNSRDYIIDDGTPVGSVHCGLGILYVIGLEEAPVFLRQMNAADDEVAQPEWLDLESALDSGRTFEPWSQHVLKKIAEFKHPLAQKPSYLIDATTMNQCRKVLFGLPWVLENIEPVMRFLSEKAPQFSHRDAVDVADIVKDELPPGFDIGDRYTLSLLMGAAGWDNVDSISDDYFRVSARAKAIDLEQIKAEAAAQAMAPLEKQVSDIASAYMKQGEVINRLIRQVERLGEKPDLGLDDNPGSQQQA